MNMVQKLVTEDSFDANGVLIPAGHIGTFDADRLSGKEKHLFDADKLDGAVAVVEMAAVGPTGPNPKLPQQIPSDAVQGAGGEYLLPGKRLVAEVTDTAEARIDDRGLRDPNKEAEVSDTLGEIMGATANNTDDALVAGNVADVTANLGAKTDEELDAMQAAENDREVPRKGVLRAIDAERAERTSRA